MSEFLSVVIASALVENIVLTNMLGLCPVLGLSKRRDLAVGVGLATVVVLTLATVVGYFADGLLGDEYQILQPLVFILIVACLVQMIELSVRFYFPLLHRSLGVFLPLIATNCAVLGVMLIALRQEQLGFLDSVALGFGGGLGFFLVINGLAFIRERIVENRVPMILRGAPLAMLTAGWMALAFSGVAGAF